ncbi:methyl-accepting chemotaxis protein [Spirochaetota bacterium]
MILENSMFKNKLFVIVITISVIVVIQCGILFVSSFMNSHTVNQIQSTYFNINSPAEDINYEEVNAQIASVIQKRSIALYSIIGLSAILILTCIVFAVLLSSSITGPITSSIETLKRVEQGDFTRMIDIKRGDELGELIRMINNTIEKLRNMIKSVLDNTNSLSSNTLELSDISKQITDNAQKMSHKFTNISTASDQMNSNIKNISSTTEESSISFNTLATSTEEMTATIGEIAQNAEKARKVAEEAVATVGKSSKKVQKLEDQAFEVNKIIDVVTEIAEQTKLLALNATIESARAGDAGKGFAVVANEVKALARQVNEAADDIRHKIETISYSTNETIEDMGAISSVIQSVNDIITVIASAVEEQTITTNDIAKNIHSTASNIKNMSANVGFSSDAAHEIVKDISSFTALSKEVKIGNEKLNINSEQLSRMASELNQMVQKFSV